MTDAPKPKRKLRRIPVEWWERTEKTATHRNVNKWPQFKARLAISACLVFWSVVVYVVVAVCAMVVLVAAAPLAVWAQGRRIHDLWTSTRDKQPAIVR
jgi:Flp pilus assembly protein TadB